MDNPDPLDNLNLSSAPEVLIAKSSPLKKILKISLISGGIIVLILALILTLNYFNILSPSSLFPKYFSFLPHQSLSQKAKNPAVASKPAKPVLSCPVPENFCAQPRMIENNGNYYALGFNLPQGTPLLAAFSGKVENEPKISNHPLLYLRDNKGNEAVYSFYGTTTIPLGNTVSVGTEIAKIGEGLFPPVAPFIGLNATFSLKKAGAFQKVSPEDFGK
ncbi:hypothetical protein KKE78_03900 [Patescibacteria group bacterium]|nr:hypothetical protein [Patescibacteria group bacterium]